MTLTAHQKKVIAVTGVGVAVLTVAATLYALIAWRYGSKIDDACWSSYMYNGGEDKWCRDTKEVWNPTGLGDLFVAFIEALAVLTAGLSLILGLTYLVLGEHLGVSNDGHAVNFNRQRRFFTLCRWTGGVLVFTLLVTSLGNIFATF